MTLFTIVLIPFVIYILAKLVMLLPQFGQQPKGKDQVRVEASPYFIQGRFRTIERIKNDMTLKHMPELMKQNSNRSIEKRPKVDLPVEKRSPLEFTNFDPEKTRITWFGHSAIYLEIDGLKILIDPMLGQYASPIPPAVKRFSKELPLEINDFPEIDLVLLSHDHYDHLDYKSILKLKSKVQYWYTPLGVGSHLKRWGVESDKIKELDWWNEINFSSLDLAFTPNKHFSGRKTNDRNKTLWGSWVIKGKKDNIYFSSDSGYWSGFKRIGEKYGPFDFAMIECGQYNHLWRENHMFPEETVQAFRDLNAKKMMPIHWGAFSLAPHDWRDPVERMWASATEKEKRNISLPKIGQSIILDEEYPQSLWWRDI